MLYRTLEKHAAMSFATFVAKISCSIGMLWWNTRTRPSPAANLSQSSAEIKSNKELKNALQSLRRIRTSAAIFLQLCHAICAKLRVEIFWMPIQVWKLTSGDHPLTARMFSKWSTVLCCVRQSEDTLSQIDLHHFLATT